MSTWHDMTTEAVLDSLDASKGGLTQAEATSRLATHGPNALPEGKRRTVLGMIADQFKDFLILLLLGAAVISGMLGELVDAIAIAVILLLNAVIGVVQEYRADRAMEALREMSATLAVVRRDGEIIEMPTEDLVPGDVVLLEAGRIVPADLRVLQSRQLRLAEAALTGESEPVDKTEEPVSEKDAPLGDRFSMIYKGTQVVYGRGEGLVVETGISTELGRIAQLISTTEDLKTPLQKRLADFGKRLGLVALALCAVVFVVGVVNGEEVLLMFLTAVSLAVAAVPEALPAVATITLAIGARRMAKSNALIRRLPAVETLGSVTYICSDKTGTLTLNRMTAEQFAVGAESVDDLASGDESIWRLLLMAMALCNDATIGSEGGTPVGDPTEVALAAAAGDAGYDRSVVESEWPRIAELPFDSERKLMTTFHSDPSGGVVSMTKGAAELVLDRSDDLVSPDARGSMGVEQEVGNIERLSTGGYRVLGFSTRHFDSIPDDLHEAERNMSFVGLAGLVDPPRPEALAAVSECVDAGIVPVMITGDHPATALAIAHKLGIAHADTEVLTGQELEGMTPHELKQRVLDTHVYARVSPEHKLSIVEALQERGQFVAMTGDGVNDAPALKQADIGVAMGITGTDVSKEAASMILLDDDFATIVKAVEEGRRIFDNIRKFVQYTMASNAGEILTILMAPLLGMPIPLFPIHILWVNLVTDGLPGLAYASEPAEKDIMKRSPRPPKQSLFAEGAAWRMVWIGVLLGASALITQAVAMSLGFDEGHWRSMVFSVLCFGQLGNALALRSDLQSVFSQGLMSNRSMASALGLTVVLQLAVLYVPVFNDVFKTAPLTLTELGIVILASSFVFWGVEAEKLWKRWKGVEPTTA